MARASSSVSGRTELGMPVGAGPDVLTLPGDRLTMLVPNWVNSASTKRWMPSPIEVSRITAAMPTRDAEQGQEAAQPLRGEGAQGEVDGIGQQHG